MQKNTQLELWGLFAKHGFPSGGILMQSLKHVSRI